jgi:HK97 family phage prohead protease
MAVDTSPWDGNRAMGECDDAADYRVICAGEHSVGDPEERQHWALPHHYLASQGKAKGPNADGVRQAKQRLSQTQDLTNRSAAETHLEAHMTEISPERSISPMLETRALTTEGWEVRHSGRADESFTVRGYAAVYDQPSLDLGGFREIVDPRALDGVLAQNPDVVFAWDHDTRLVGARTSNGTLTLRNDPNGLWIDARIGPYSWAKDLRTGLERRDITQGSFGFIVPDGEDDWDLVEGTVVRTIRNISFLADVTVTAQGAYPQTNMVAAARSLHAATSTGRLPTDVEGRVAAMAAARSIPWPEEAASVAPEEGGEPSHEGGQVEERQDVRALRNEIAVERDNLSDMLERVNRL